MPDHEPENQAGPAGSVPRDHAEFCRLLESLPAGAYTCDLNGLITYFNQRAVDLWGRAPNLNDPVDRYCGSFKLFSAAGAPINHDQCWMALALQDRAAYNGQEILVERPDGDRRTVLAHANPLLNEAGQLIGAVNVLVDITDQRRFDETHSLLANIVSSSDDAIVSKTLQGHILTWNAGARRIFGYEPWEAIGRPITMLIPLERHDEEQTILARLRRGERIEHYETVRVTKDGRRVDVSITVSPLRDSAGRIVGASKVARDITARKRAEEDLLSLKDELASQVADLRRLHEMSVRLWTTVELTPILEETLRTAAAVEGADFGLLSLCDAEEKYLEVGTSLGFDEEFLQAIKQVQTGCAACGIAMQEARRVVIEDIDLDSRMVEYRDMARRAGFRAVHSTPLITRKGKVVGVLSTHFRRPHRPSDREIHLLDLCARQAVDFIENARLYQQLRDADRYKDEFLATLAHELRNPLAPISNALHLLRMSGDLPPSTERIRGIMEGQIRNMVRLVDDLMEVSRITRGRIELRREPTELAAVLESAVETSRPLIEASGHQLAIAVSPELMTVDVDPVRIAQVIANVLNNAAKYTDHGGQIWLTARRDGDDAMISVRDTGAGISAEMLPRVFDMFAQVDRTIDRAQGGLGIGLTLAKTLVQMHGGQIEARSEGPGRGSEFVVRLPLAQPTVPVLVPAQSPRKSGATLPARQVLVVDDAPAAAYLLGKLLERLGQRVRTAADADNAMKLARAQRPDIVISDIGMPRIDGYELAERLRREPGLDGVVLVALTGYGQDADRQRALEAGFDHHLVKPVGVDDLQKLLGSLPPPVVRPDEAVAESADDVPSPRHAR